MASAADYSQRLTDDLGVDPADVLRFETAAGAGERLDRFLAIQLPKVSRSRIQQWIALGAVWCETRALAGKTRLYGVETLFVAPLPREADTAFAPDPVPLSVVYEDHDLIVVEKPAGLVVHPAPGNWRNTLLNGLLYHRPAHAALARAGIVHRLDKDTSGLMVVAASEDASQSLIGQLADRSMSRRYLAWVAGLLDQPRTIDAPIGRDPAQRVRMAVVPGGKPARTHVMPLATGRLEGRAVSLVECRLDTGRTHQIRVHLAHQGFPLLGDRLYDGPMAGIERQALHAWRLGLVHPSSGKPVSWQSMPPDDFIALSVAAGADLPALVEGL